MTTLICVGACYVDTILSKHSVPHFPEEDSKLRATSLKVRRGGNCPNSLEVLQQLLAALPAADVLPPPCLISALPAKGSSATRMIRDSFGPADDTRVVVDLTRCVYREGCADPASSYIIRSEATDSRTLVSFNDLPEVTVEEFAEAASGLQGKTWWHFEGRAPETTLQCIMHLRKAYPDARISVEVEKPGREGLQELAAEANVVFYSKSWAQDQGYSSAEECLEAQCKVTSKASLLFCTWGSDGASCLSVDDGRCWSCPALIPGGEAIRVVDTVGAGDTFVAGILFGLLYHGEEGADNMERVVQLAVKLATSKVQREGFAVALAEM